MRTCGYPAWSLKEGELRGKRQLRKEQEKQQGTDKVEEKKCKQYAVLSYMKSVTKKLQRAFRKHNIVLYAKAGSLSGMSW